MSDIVEKVALAIVNGYWDELPELHKVLAMSQARAALDAIRASGYVIVPREPTLAMKVAGAEAITKEHMKALANYDAACDAWPAMIAAAEGE